MDDDTLWFWCLHCERCYKAGEHRYMKGIRWCPYEDCDGDVVLDAWPWDFVRESHPEYPEEPVREHEYPLY